MKSKRAAIELKNDSVKSALAAKLIYVNDRQPGISRVRKGDKFQYYLNGKLIKDKGQLERIKKLVIPPAWENVWICTSENGHLQVTGYDQKNRKQYRYHPSWNKLRNQTKYDTLYEFGKNLPRIREQLEKDLALKGLPREKVLASIVSLMELTHIRIGGSFYEKAYGSYGLSTMKDKHVKVNGSSIQFTFKGKKGVQHHIDIKSKKLARIVQQCKDIPGKELFQYYDEEGNIHSIDSGEVNEYIKNISGSEFTSKDFRTWSETLKCMIVFKELGVCETVTDTKSNIVTAIDSVARELGNTRAVCKSHYIHPFVIACYENKDLDKFFSGNGNTFKGLTNEEVALMKLLRSA